MLRDRHTRISTGAADSLDAMYRVNLHAPVLLTAALLSNPDEMLNVPTIARLLLGALTTDIHVRPMRKA